MTAQQTKTIPGSNCGRLEDDRNDEYKNMEQAAEVQEKTRGVENVYQFAPENCKVVCQQKTWDDEFFSKPLVLFASTFNLFNWMKPCFP